MATAEGGTHRAGGDVPFVREQPGDRPEPGALTVLVMEDCAETREIFRMVLEARGFRVVEAGDGVEGVRLASVVEPDVVLTDLVMPRMDGLEAARRLRSDPTTAHIPIVAATGSSGQRERAEGSEGPFQRVLVKPVSPNELTRAILEAQHGHRAA